MAASTLSRTPNGTELALRQLIRVRIETRWRATKQEQKQKQKPYEGKSEEQTLTPVTCFIEDALLVTNLEWLADQKRWPTFSTIDKSPSHSSRI
jgi:hypothetical protein